MYIPALSDFVLGLRDRVLQPLRLSQCFGGAQRRNSAAEQSASRACIICLSSHTMCDRRNLNVSRRLMYMLKVSGLPRVGGAHTLRMRYVQVKHALLILQGKCTRESIAKKSPSAGEASRPRSVHQNDKMRGLKK
jgi:hypothetical protein